MDTPRYLVRQCDAVHGRFGREASADSARTESYFAVVPDVLPLAARGTVDPDTWRLVCHAIRSRPSLVPVAA